MPQTTSFRDDERGILVFSWPEDVPLPDPRLNIYPIGPPHYSRRLLRIFLGPELNNEDDASLVANLRNYLVPPMEGLCITAHSEAWTCERAGTVNELVPPFIKYQETRVLNFELQREFAGFTDTEFGFNDVSTIATFPADLVDAERAPAVISDLKGLGVIYILPPLSPEQFSRDRDAHATGTKLLFQNTPRLTKCAIPLDFSLQVEDILHILLQYPALQQLELLSPVTFDLLELVHSSDPHASKLTTAIIRGLTFFTQLQKVTIPISLVTAELVRCLAHLPNLSILKIQPDERVSSTFHFLRGVQGAGILGPDEGDFASLLYLELGLQNNHGHDQDAIPFLEMILPKVIIM